MISSPNCYFRTLQADFLFLLQEINLSQSTHAPFAGGAGFLKAYQVSNKSYLRLFVTLQDRQKSFFPKETPNYHNHANFR
jgi:hypothetical protein